jgi:threonyl-tRNA synthetase
LPLRVAEGQVLHRNENTGSLHGILRGRNFVQDDAHIFLASEHVRAEFQTLLQMLDTVYGVFALKYGLRLSTRPAEFLGDADTWDRAEADLKAALNFSGKEFVLAEGEGAFYGPKIDVTIHDSLGREWQCATFQLDFQLPLRFDLEYAAEDGSRQRPIVIHRAIFGSFERFIGVLIEHLNGRFPSWVAPVQLAVLPISDKFAAYAAEIEQQAQAAGLRCEIHQEGSLNQRIRVASKSRIPNVCVVGAKELEAKTVSWRSYSGENITLKLEAFLETLVQRVKTRFFDTAVTAVQPPSLKDGTTPQALNVEY